DDPRVAMLLLWRAGSGIRVRRTGLHGRRIAGFVGPVGRSCDAIDAPPTIIAERVILSRSKEAYHAEYLDCTMERAAEPYVRPVAGTLDVGVASDALYLVGEQHTDEPVTVQYEGECPDAGSGGGGVGGGARIGTVGTAGDPTGSPVKVLDQSVVGPYETVQV